MISGNRHQSSSRVEKRHKDRLKRTDTNLDCKDENKSRKLDRGSHHDMLEGTSKERDERTPGHSSRRDDVHSKESCSQMNSKSSGAREKNDGYHRPIFYEDASCSHGKGKECKTISRKYTSMKEKGWHILLHNTIIIWRLQLLKIKVPFFRSWINETRYLWEWTEEIWISPSKNVTRLLARAL